jgi:UDP-GlcNAc:undecaprenyl-phosphate GlcNAc-1-phosphate transferase
MNWLLPTVSALVTFLLITAILRGKWANKLWDIPNQRSLHSVPIPRSGGIGLIAGILSGWAGMFNEVPWWLLLPLMGLYILSLLDDMYCLPVSRRLTAQMVAAAVLLVGSGMLTGMGVLALAFALSLIVWMTNLYNFMDGSDGLAGGMALLGFAFYGIAALMEQDSSLAVLNFCVSAATLGFLYYNFSPAKIFMGDAGSIPLGFLAAAMGMWGWHNGDWQVWFPLIVFSPFIVDASVTLAKRTLRGEKITQAHRDHYYQRAIRMGWSHRYVALAEYALMMSLGMSALFCVKNTSPWGLLVFWGAIFAVLMWKLDLMWKNQVSQLDSVE